MRGKTLPGCRIKGARAAACALTLLFSAISACAQMQIPNPLIRPHSLANPDLPPVPAPPARSGAATAYPAVPAAIPGLVSDDPYLRELSELRERFAGFHVAAIVGKHAVLRRSLAQRGPATALAAPPSGASMAPVSLGPGTPPTALRNDAMTLSDGQVVNAISLSGSLVARVSERQVAIFHVVDGTTRGAGQRTIVFAGELEASGAPPPPTIVLERPDPAYKRSITVESKVRSASSGDAAAATAPAAPASPTQPQQ
ncbi:hypothetical protein RCH09_002330 [Actimicrobium sp. GrIS 1.19]|uniref:hypothetical protein n=1 Tax=Actimicrobium sp. GrIS 1.19 TaxID=3071708 RepID=UPI002DFB00CF|nr:hypothetical protein [Actimicrobium sp. GrIS 1.19]